MDFDNKKFQAKQQAPMRNTPNQFLITLSVRISQQKQFIHLIKSHLQAMHSHHLPLDSQVIIGQIEPEIQGWHSARFIKKVVSLCLHYSTQISEPTVLAWLFSHEFDALALHSVHMTDQSIHVQISKAAKMVSLTIDLPGPLKQAARIRHSTFH